MQGTSEKKKKAKTQSTKPHKYAYLGPKVHAWGVQDLQKCPKN